MKLTNIKVKVETDEENQSILQQHIKLNKESDWYVSLGDGHDYWLGQSGGCNRAVCSVWKGFRHLSINSEGDLLLFAFQKHYNITNEKEITFEEFKKMCGDVEIDLPQTTATFKPSYDTVNNKVALENGVEVHLPDGFTMSNLMYEASNKNTRVIFEIEEPKKTLWDKRTRINDGYFELPHVKEALKELFQYIDSSFNAPEIKRKAKEIFGEELVK